MKDIFESPKYAWKHPFSDKKKVEKKVKELKWEEIEKKAKQKKIKFGITAHPELYMGKSNWAGRIEFPDDEEGFWVGSKSQALLKKRIMREIMNY